MLVVSRKSTEGICIRPGNDFADTLTAKLALAGVVKDEATAELCRLAIEELRNDPFFNIFFCIVSFNGARVRVGCEATKEWNIRRDEVTDLVS